MTSLAEQLAPRVDGIGFGVATMLDYQRTPLRSEEVRASAGMLAARKQEFWLGRSAAHRALANLGVQDGAILRSGRRPVFPGGLSGSLSHSAGVAVAIVAKNTRARGLGIDLELKPLPTRAARLVLRPDEMWCVEAGHCSCAQAFSAKEAGFKALEPLLECGTALLRQLSIEPASDGFRVRHASWPQLHAAVSVCDIAGGILAWAIVG